jgi:hypothetical protein
MLVALLYSLAHFEYRGAGNVAPAPVISCAAAANATTASNVVMSFFTDFSLVSE